jgi:peptidoglycan/LPS O-acetylase OafA/YrhL
MVRRVTSSPGVTRRPAPAPTTVRPDITGLRGLAIALVLLAHFDVPGLSAGFIGVDIFFVTSGFLMTLLLVCESENRALHSTGWAWISLRGFYLGRIRRILPIALVVAAATVAASRLLLEAARQRAILEDALWSSTLAANIRFQRQPGDFIVDAATSSPFQHYWALGVEAQFLLIWPLLFMTAVALHRLQYKGKPARRHARVMVMISAVIFMSLAVSVVSSLLASDAQFSVFARAWQFGAGALLAVAVVRIHKSVQVARVLGLAGVAFLVGALAVTRADNLAWSLLFPVLAAVCLIGAGCLSPATPTSRLLSWAPLRGLGTIAISLYLWHWPVISIGTNAGLITSGTTRAIAAALCLVLATFTYWSVERTFKRIPVNKLSPRNQARNHNPYPMSWRSNAKATVVVLTLLALATYMPVPI